MSWIFHCFSKSYTFQPGIVNDFGKILDLFVLLDVLFDDFFRFSYDSPMFRLGEAPFSDNGPCSRAHALSVSNPKVDDG